MKNTANSDKGVTCKRRPLKFTCCHCHGTKLEEIVMVLQEVTSIHASHDPLRDGTNDSDGNIVLRKKASSRREGRLFRCHHCERELRDANGKIGYGRQFLLDWLNENCEQRES